MSPLAWSGLLGRADRRGAAGAMGDTGDAAPLLLALGAVALGRALQDGNGTGTPLAFVLLGATLLVSLVAVAMPRAAWVSPFGARLAVVALGAGVAYQLSQFFGTHPGSYLRLPRVAFPYADFHAALAVSALLCGVSLTASRLVARAAFVLLLVLHFAICCWMIQISPSPFIDVFVWHNEAFAALGAGSDPYALSMPNIYGHGLFYAPGTVAGDRVLVGFPYPPVSLALAGLGHLAGGDYRYALAGAITLSGALMGFARPGAVAFGAAAVLLFTPRVFFVVEQGWTEPFAVFLLGVVGFVAVRRPRWLPWALGALLAVKQYMVFALPLSALLLPRPLALRDVGALWLKAGALAAATLLPFFLWHPQAFFGAMAVFQLNQPFRSDSLSFLALLAQASRSRPFLWLTFAVSAALVCVCLWRARRDVAGFVAALGLVIGGFFAFSKQAFCNYYFFVLGALCLAAALSRPSYGSPAAPDSAGAADGPSTPA